MEFAKHRLDTSRKMNTKQSWTEKNSKPVQHCYPAKWGQYRNKMQRQGALVNNTKLFKAFHLIQTQRIISWECLLWPFPYLEAPFIFRLTTADCYSLKLFQLTLAADPVPQGPLCTPSLGHWHCIDTNTEIFTFLQPYFSTLLKAGFPSSFKKKKWKYGSALQLHVSSRTESHKWF